MQHVDHSITFIDPLKTTGGTKNTWDDWHLIPTSRPVFNPPEMKTMTVDIPGGYGALDMSEALTGYPLYKNRTGDIEFAVHNDFGNWADRYSEIMNFIHGKNMKAILEDDPDYYYYGRFSVNEWKSGSWYSKITLEYNVKPFKLDQKSSTDEWLWDPFNFETGIIRYAKGISVAGSYTLKIPSMRMHVCPTINVSLTGNNTMKVSYAGTTYNISNGKNVIPAIVTGEKDISLVFTGTGKVTVDYRGGSL